MRRSKIDKEKQNAPAVFSGTVERGAVDITGKYPGAEYRRHEGTVSGREYEVPEK